MKRNLIEFKTECDVFLNAQSLNALRALGRYIGVEHSTKKLKSVLIQDIIAVLVGDQQPVSRSNRGAPVKNDFFDPQILQKLEEMRFAYVTGLKTEKKPAETEKPKGLSEYDSLRQSENVLRVESSNSEVSATHSDLPVYFGQLETVNGISCLYALNGKAPMEKIVVTVDQIRVFDLHDGDVISCNAVRRQGVLVLLNILTLNGETYKKSVRQNFDEMTAIYPTERLLFSKKGTMGSVEKYLEWLLPLGKGQRAIISAPVKAGKSYFLQELARALTAFGKEITVFALLIDQSPEAIDEYANILPKENLVCTSFDAMEEDHVFAAEFLLKRAKRYAESGKDVFLIVDSLTALAHAYNATEYSSGGKTFACGLEKKTVRYLKNYFGAARNFEKSGSLAVLGAMTLKSGDATDDILFAELSSVANMLVNIDADLASKRIFPAISVTSSKTERSDLLFSEEEADRERFIRSQYLPVFSEQRLHRLVEDSESLSELYSHALAELSKS